MRGAFVVKIDDLLMDFKTITNKVFFYNEDVFPLQKWPIVHGNTESE
jgi:hypothetical protein